MAIRLSDDQKAVLNDVLEELRRDAPGTFPAITHFRLRHEKRRNAIDELVARQLLVPDRGQYALPLEGLLACNSEEAKLEIEAINALIPRLRDLYRDAPSERWVASDAAARANLATSTVKRSLTLISRGHLREIFHGIDYDSLGLVEIFSLDEAVLDATPVERERTEGGSPADARRQGTEQRRMDSGLTGIRIEGLTSLADVRLEPGRLTVLIGPNGSGKSNILNALKMLSHFQAGTLEAFVGRSGGAAALLHYGPKRTRVVDIELTLRGAETQGGYSVKLELGAGDRLVFREEQVGNIEPGDSVLSWTLLGAGQVESHLSAPDGADRAGALVRDWLSQLNSFHFHDTSIESVLRGSSRTVDDRALLSDGRNLASFLYRLQHSEEDADQAAWTRINYIVRRVAPSIRELSPTSIDDRERSVRLDWVDDKGERFAAHQLSDGTLRAIALITALAQPAKTLPKFISIDEPELGLHPAAIAILADLARSVSKHAQILFATQSTEFLNHFDVDEVVVVERFAGATVLNRLDRIKLDEWLDEYTLADVFNRGIIGGRP